MYVAFPVELRKRHQDTLYQIYSIRICLLTESEWWHIVIDSLPGAFG